jgi:hypothetical protein
VFTVLEDVDDTVVEGVVRIDDGVLVYITGPTGEFTVLDDDDEEEEYGEKGLGAGGRPMLEDVVDLEDVDADRSVELVQADSDELELELELPLAGDDTLGGGGGEALEDADDQDVVVPFGDMADESAVDDEVDFDQLNGEGDVDADHVNAEDEVDAFGGTREEISGEGVDAFDIHVLDEAEDLGGEPEKPNGAFVVELTVFEDEDLDDNEDEDRGAVDGLGVVDRLAEFKLEVVDVFVVPKTTAGFQGVEDEDEDEYDAVEDDKGLGGVNGHPSVVLDVVDVFVVPKTMAGFQAELDPVED